MDPVVAQKIADFFAQYPVRRFPAGQIIIQAHDEPESVYYLLEGRVKQYDISYRGDEVVLNVFKPPAFFPMSYAMNHTPNDYFFEAEATVEAHVAPGDAAVAFIKQNPDVLYDLLGRVYRGTDGLIGRLAHLMAGSARSRLMYELLIECRRFGKVRGHGTAVALTETDLAARAGLARETVSREINKLKTDGLLSVIKGEIWVNDVDQLALQVGREL